jgi:hypothetical protein
VCLEVQLQNVKSCGAFWKMECLWVFQFLKCPHWLLQGITEKRLKHNKSNQFSHSVMPLGVEWSSGSKHPPEVEPPLSSTWVGCLLPELSTPLMVLYTKGVRSIHFRTLLKQSVDVSHSDPKNRLLEKWYGEFHLTLLIRYWYTTNLYDPIQTENI